MKSNMSKLILATLGGIALGSAIGLLFAPESGAKTRKRITGSAASIDDYIDDIISEGKKSWKKMKAGAKDTTEDMESYLDHLVSEGKKSWVRMQEELAEKANNADESKTSKVVREGKRLWNSLTHKAEEIAGDAKDTAYDGYNYAKRQAQKTSAETA
jgi:gas vesicle protein